ncbi:MAG: DNA repair protein RecO [Caldimicrobium sp.]|nr:DNA repair protein RecO [Caldimicrobium sp.]MCX7872952.1 DNA repair protein RecO [Caldimicrobium sp.]MDW8094570.1 DNA repair protein RecO [Caldimicrobium sp.]
MLFSLPGIVLDKIKCNEIDYLIDLLTPRGKLRVIAKGAQKSKRRFVNLLEDLTSFRAHLRKPKRGKIPILESADPLYIPESPRFDLAKYYFFSYVAEVLTLTSLSPLRREDFWFLTEFIKDVDRLPWENYYKIFFELKWLYINGFGPHLDSCVRCHEKPRRIFYFSIPSGGLLCINCRDGQSRLLTSSQIDLLREMAKIDNLESMKNLIRGFSLDEERVLSALIEAFFLYYLDWEPRSLPFLKDRQGITVYGGNP